MASTGDVHAQSQRDRHVRFIAERGRMSWQRATGYGGRSLAETAVGRHKAIIGPKLRARSLPARRGEASIAVEVLNRMIRAAKPVSVRTGCDVALLQGPMSASLPPCTNAPRDGSASAPQGALRHLLGMPLFRRLLLVTGLVQGSHALYGAFATLHWQAAGIGPQTIGALWSVAVASEVAVFLLIGPRLLRRIGPAGLRTRPRTCLVA